MNEASPPDPVPGKGRWPASWQGAPPLPAQGQADISILAPQSEWLVFCLPGWKAWLSIMGGQGKLPFEEAVRPNCIHSVL